MAKDELVEFTGKGRGVGPGSEVILEGSPAGTIEPKKPILGRLVPFPIAAMGRSHKGLLPQGRDSV
jgi:hypothetical protein